MVPLRQYYPVWYALKTKGSVSITAARPFHRRIIRAVIKEKYQDIAWHFELSELGQKKRLKYEITESKIRFYLENFKGIYSL